MTAPASLGFCGRHLWWRCGWVGSRPLHAPLPRPAMLGASSRPRRSWFAGWVRAGAGPMRRFEAPTRLPLRAERRTGVAVRPFEREAGAIPTLAGSWRRGACGSRRRRESGMGIGKLASFPRRRTACAASWPGLRPLLVAAAAPCLVATACCPGHGRRRVSGLRPDAGRTTAHPGGDCETPDAPLGVAFYVSPNRAGGRGVAAAFGHCAGHSRYSVRRVSVAAGAVS